MRLLGWLALGLLLGCTEEPTERPSAPAVADQITISVRRVSGEIDPATVEAALRDETAELDHCFRLTAGPPTEGREMVTLAMTVAPAGRVTNVSGVADDNPNDRLRGCLRGVLVDTTLPHGGGLVMARISRGPPEVTEPAGEETAAGARLSPSEAEDVRSIREAIRRRLEGAGDEGAVLLRFYEARDFLPAFYDESARPRTHAITELTDAVEGAPSHGLAKADYHFERLAAQRATPPTTPEAIAIHDVLLSDAFVTLATHLLRGKVDPVHIHPAWTAHHRAGDVLALLRRGLADDPIGEVLASAAPSDEGYARLREALARYRALERSAPPPAPLGQLLEALGDLEEGDDLESAIRHFQRRHGIAASGVVDERTEAALSVPMAARVETLRVNLERARWLPEDLGERQVRVNIAGFDLRYIEGGAVRLRMRAIVGKPYRKTPVFSDTIRYLVLNPTWTVPSTIFREDLLPEVRRDRRTLARRGLEVLNPDGRIVDPATVQWRRVHHGDLYLRQPAGPNNALGPVKFMFPNPYDVYMHGTPRQDLFEEAERAFSSGCIRLERPLDLAALLLADQPGYALEDLERIVRTRRTQTVHLTTPVPVHLLYATAWVEPDGTVQFRRDIYERDDAVSEALGAIRPALQPAEAAPTP